MAVTLSIDLTDAEQAKASAWLDVLLPGLTEAEKKATLEHHGKKLLRDDLIARISRVRAIADRDAENAQRQADEAAITVDDPFDPPADV